MSDPIDWPGIRANAVTLGIRGAARAAAIDLSAAEQDRFVERVMKRASREGWEKQRVEIQALAPKGQSGVRILSAPVRSGADALSAHLAKERDLTATAMSRIALKTALSARNQPLTVETPADLLALAKAHAVIHRIDQASQGSTINILVQ